MSTTTISFTKPFTTYLWSEEFLGSDMLESFDFNWGGSSVMPEGFDVTATDVKFDMESFKSGNNPYILLIMVVTNILSGVGLTL